MSKDGYKNNYMARRAHLFGLLESNPNWTQGEMVEWETGAKCDVGYAYSHATGKPDEDVFYTSMMLITDEVAQIYGIKRTTVDNIMWINDSSPNFATNVKALRSYLLHRNLKRAKSIVRRARAEV